MAFAVPALAAPVNEIDVIVRIPSNSYRVRAQEAWVNTSNHVGQIRQAQHGISDAFKRDDGEDDAADAADDAADAADDAADDADDANDAADDAADDADDDNDDADDDADDADDDADDADDDADDEDDEGDDAEGAGPSAGPSTLTKPHL